MSFYAALGLEVGHFGPLWHLLKIAQLAETDLNRISGLHGLSIADFHLLGALMMEGDRPLRATDLAGALNVSNAALTGRIRKLADRDLVARGAERGDRRAARLSLTPHGRDKVRAVATALERDGLFLHYYRRLAPADQAVLGRVLGDLHTLIERHFVPAPRPYS